MSPEEIIAEKFPWSIVYRTPYDDDEVIALFTTESNARRVCEAWAADTRDDEEVVVRDSNAALSSVKFFG